MLHVGEGLGIVVMLYNLLVEIQYLVEIHPCSITLVLDQISNVSISYTKIKES